LSLPQNAMSLKWNTDRLFNNDQTVNFRNDEETRIYYPKNFTPQAEHVMFGSEKIRGNHIANKKLDEIIALRIHVYKAEINKIEKSKMISSIVTEIRKGDTKPGGFLQKDQRKDLWFDIGDVKARQKISQMFRDYLHEGYKSSSYNKKKRRQSQSENSSPKANKRFHFDDITQIDAVESYSNEYVGTVESLEDNIISKDISVNDILSIFDSYLPISTNDNHNPNEPVPIASLIEKYVADNIIKMNVTFQEDGKILWTR